MQEPYTDPQTGYIPQWNCWLCYGNLSPVAMGQGPNRAVP
jgi:hypothetical protein